MLYNYSIPYLELPGLFILLADELYDLSRLVLLLLNDWLAILYGSTLCALGGWGARFTVAGERGVAPGVVEPGLLGILETELGVGI